MKSHRLAGILLLGLLTAVLAFLPDAALAAPPEEGAAESLTAPLFRVFLKDGRTLVSYGEFARVGERVVFSMPTSASVDNPQLHLVDLPSDRVDWLRTVNYAESARAARYLSTRAEADYTAVTAEIAQALNDVAHTTDPVRRLAIVERARKSLADWPTRHYGYKQDDVRQMLGMLDEAIAELRAMTGGQQFDLMLVAAVEAPRLLEPLLPAPTAKETIEQTLEAASLTDSPAERVSLLSVAASGVVRDADTLPAEWVTTVKASISAAIAHEDTIDRAYRSLTTRIVSSASERARAADVRGVQRLLGQIKESDEALGGARPDVVLSLLAEIDAQLDAARRLRLARDRWAIRAPELRSYRDAVAASLVGLVQLAPALEDIKALAGSGPDTLAAIIRAAAVVLKAAQTLTPPEELAGVHSLLLSAAQLADAAARYRREAALTGDMKRAWDASSAAAGALMLSERAQTEMQSALRVPQLVR